MRLVQYACLVFAVGCLVSAVLWAFTVHGTPSPVRPAERHVTLRDGTEAVCLDFKAWGACWPVKP